MPLTQRLHYSHFSHFPNPLQLAGDIAKKSDSNCRLVCNWFNYH